MAVVKGVKEKVHLPLYDSLFVKPKEQLSKTQSSNVLRFFQDVTGKTKLQTNMQAASLLPHWNTYEARALRVVISDLAPQFPDAPTVELTGVPVVNCETGEPAADGAKVTVRGLSVLNFIELRRRINCDPIRLRKGEIDCLRGSVTVEGNLGHNCAALDRAKLQELAEKLASQGVSVPPDEQIFPHDGFGSLIGKFIYNTVTTFFVGEKIMIQVPTWFFPAGAGPYSEDGKVTTHGEPSPEATFRFAEPIFIDTQQNFRVEIEIPESDVLRDLQRLYGPLFIWVVLDGYMTRDVQ